MEVFGGFYPINGEQSYHNHQKAYPCVEIRHTAYRPRSLRSVHLLLHSSPFLSSPPNSYALQWATDSPKSAHSSWGICTPSTTYGSLDPPRTTRCSSTVMRPKKKIAAAAVRNQDKTISNKQLDIRILFVRQMLFHRCPVCPVSLLVLSVLSACLSVVSVRPVYLSVTLV